MVTPNPTDAIEVNFGAYVKKRKLATEAHMEGGIPDYAFGMDYALRQKINAIPGAVGFFKAMVNHVGPRLKMQINSAGIKVGPGQFPEVYEMAADCARLLGIGIPSVYIAERYETITGLNAFTMATDDNEPIIVILTALLERLTPGELKAIIGHECGHIHNNHAVYQIAADFVISMGGAIPGISQLINLASLPLRTALLKWSRAGEVTCDRAGVICCDEPIDAQMAQAKLLYGAALNREAVDLDAVLKQYEAMRVTPYRVKELFQTHPNSIRRILAIKEFLYCDVLYGWRPEWKGPGMELIGKKELDARCESFISVSKSMAKGGAS